MEGSPEGDKGLEAVQPTSPPWGMAAGRVEELVRGSEILALLRAAERTGFLRLLTRSVVSDDLAAALHLPVSRVDAALDVLAAHGIAEVRGDHWELAEGWSELVLGETPLPFAAYLGLGDVWTGQFETSLSSSRTYWQLDGASRLAVAKGISPEPSSSFTIAAARRDLQALPGVVPSLDAGGRVLELGCGVGSRLCATLLAFPSARAVGVELDAKSRRVCAESGRDSRARESGVVSRRRCDGVRARGCVRPRHLESVLLPRAHAVKDPGDRIRRSAPWRMDHDAGHLGRSSPATAQPRS